MKMESFIKPALVLWIIGLVSSQSCPENWELFEGSCYRYLPGFHSAWDSAQSACVSAGGNLASISTQTENTHIYEMMLQNNPQPQLNNYWIGMFKEGAGLNYKWVDGSGVVYTAWAPGEPSDSSGEDNCVQVLVDGEHLWDDTDCTTSNGFVCETNIVQECPSEWDAYGDSCYKYVPDGVQDWSTAELYCTSQEAHLTSINSEAEASYIHSQMEANNPLPTLRRYWTGLFRQGSGNNFAWNDGSPYSYQKWAPGQPDNYWFVQDCGLVFAGEDKYVGFWDDSECDVLIGYVCKMPKEGRRKEGKGDSLKQYHSINHLVDVAGQASENSINTDGLSTGATAGIVLGGLVAFVCVGTIIFMIMYKHKKMTKQTPPVVTVDMTGNHI